MLEISENRNQTSWSSSHVLATAYALLVVNFFVMANASTSNAEGAESRADQSQVAVSAGSVNASADVRIIDCDQQISDKNKTCPKTSDSSASAGPSLLMKTSIRIPLVEMGIEAIEKANLGGQVHRVRVEMLTSPSVGLIKSVKSFGANLQSAGVSIEKLESATLVLRFSDTTRAKISLPLDALIGSPARP